MLVQYSDEYPLVLRLVVISLLVPADTSECERIFSLMNDIKTDERARMGQKNLKNLMLWHRLAKELIVHVPPSFGIWHVHVGPDPCPFVLVPLSVRGLCSLS